MMKAMPQSYCYDSISKIHLHPLKRKPRPAAAMLTGSALSCPDQNLIIRSDHITSFPATPG